MTEETCGKLTNEEREGRRPTGSRFIVPSSLGSCTRLLRPENHSHLAVPGTLFGSLGRRSSADSGENTKSTRRYDRPERTFGASKIVRLTVCHFKKNCLKVRSNFPRFFIFFFIFEKSSWTSRVFFCFFSECFSHVYCWGKRTFLSHHCRCTFHLFGAPGRCNEWSLPYVSRLRVYFPRLDGKPVIERRTRVIPLSLSLLFFFCFLIRGCIYQSRRIVGSETLEGSETFVFFPFFKSVQLPSLSKQYFEGENIFVSVDERRTLRLIQDITDHRLPFFGINCLGSWTNFSVISSDHRLFRSPT